MSGNVKTAQRGQGMVEYIIMALIALAAIGTLRETASGQS